MKKQPRVVRFSLLLWLMPALLWAQVMVNPAAYKSAPGTLAVATFDTVLVDAARQREVPIRIYRPKLGKASERLPLIVVSHGLGGSREGYGYLGQHWASHGYAVVMPTHKGTDREVAMNGGFNALVRAAMDLDNAAQRPQDIRFVLDQILAGVVVPLRDRVDGGRIGVAGHSFGAHTALATAGQTMRDGSSLRSFRDERIRAVLAMSTQRPGTLGLTPDAWQPITIPAFTMTGTLDTGLGIDDVRERRLAFDGMDKGVKYHLTIDGARHAAFSDSRAERIRRDPRHHDWIKQCSTAFWDAFLRQDAGARRWLDTSVIETVSEGACVLERKGQ